MFQDSYILYHYPICPFSRKVRVFLKERGIEFDMQEVKIWLRNKDFLKLNPANETPVLKNQTTGEVICDSFVICEYIEDILPSPKDLLSKGFLGDNPIDRAEIRRLELWFDKKFYNEVGSYVLEEKVYNRFMDSKSTPNTKKLKAAQINLSAHLKYIEYLLKDRKWLAGEDFTIADIAAATQLSSMDYFGEINWNYYKKVKDWYATIKSKPNFQPLLKDQIKGFKPVKWYDDLDF
jgi:glutathione S-transferase